MNSTDAKPTSWNQHQFSKLCSGSISCFVHKRIGNICFRCGLQYKKDRSGVAGIFWEVLKGEGNNSTWTHKLYMCRGGTSWGRPPQLLSLVAPPAGPVERLSDGARDSTQPCVSAVPHAWVIMARARTVVMSWPRPSTPKSYKYWSPFGLGEIQSVWCTSDWQPRNHLQTSDSAPGHPSPLGSVEIPWRSLQ